MVARRETSLRTSLWSHRWTRPRFSQARSRLPWQSQVTCKCRWISKEKFTAISRSSAATFSWSLAISWRWTTCINSHLPALSSYLTELCRQNLKLPILKRNLISCQIAWSSLVMQRLADLYSSLTDSHTACISSKECTHTYSDPMSGNSLTALAL